MESKAVDVLNLIRLTFLDLRLKNVILVKQELRKTHPKDPYSRDIILIRRGKNFNSYNPDDFEIFFTSILKEGHYFNIRTYLRRVYQDLPSNYECYQNIQKGSDSSKYFVNNLFSSLFRLTFLNNNGRHLRKEIGLFLKDINLNISQWIKQEPEKAIEIILFLKGNIFLIENLEQNAFSNLIISTGYKKEVAEYAEGWLWHDLYSQNIDYELHNCIETLDISFSEADGMDGDYGIDFS